MARQLFPWSTLMFENAVEDSALVLLPPDADMVGRKCIDVGQPDIAESCVTRIGSCCPAVFHTISRRSSPHVTTSSELSQLTQLAKPV